MTAPTTPEIPTSFEDSPQTTPTVSFAEAFRFWLQLGFISFGGPAGQIAIMHRELVDQRRWVSEKRFLHALNFCMLLPGPEAQQLATYLGWLMHRTRGGIVAGVLFVLPSLLLLIALSWIYMAHGEQPLVAAVFYGIKPAVAAIVLHALHRIASRSLGNPLLEFHSGLGLGNTFPCSCAWRVIDRRRARTRRAECAGRRCGPGKKIGR